MTSVVTIAVGLALLTISLAMGHAEYHLINWATFLLGSIMVVVGTGQMFFLER